MNLQEVLLNHDKFLRGIEGGVKADLSDADLRGAGLVILQAGLWTAFIQKDAIRIGCQYHSTDAWRGFNDAEISVMNANALDYWNKNKEIIISIADSISVKEKTQ